MKNQTPARIILELTASNWYFCLQVLQRALESVGWIRALLIAGENSDLCKKIELFWSEIIEASLGLEYSKSGVEELYPMPDNESGAYCYSSATEAEALAKEECKAAAIVTVGSLAELYQLRNSSARSWHSTVVNYPDSENNLQTNSAKAARTWGEKKGESIPPIQLVSLPGVEASVIVLSSDLNLWMQIEPVKTPENTHQNWQVSLIFDPHKIVELLAIPAIATVLPYYSELMAADLTNNNSIVKRLWLQLLSLLQPYRAIAPAQQNHSSHAAKQIEKHENWRENTLKLASNPQMSSTSVLSSSSLESASIPVLLEPLFWESPIGILCESLDGGILRANPAFEKLIGYTEAQLRRLDCRAISHPEDFAAEVRCIQQIVRGSLQRQTLQKRYICRDGTIVWTEVTISQIDSAEADDRYLLVFVKDVTSIQRAEQELQKRRQWEALLSEIAATIRSSFDFPKILEIAVRRLRSVLNTDRVLAYQLQPDQSGVCVAEAVEPAYPVIWRQTFSPETIPTSYLKAYSQGRLWHTADIYAEALSVCHQQMLEAMKVRSMMAVPIQRPDDELQEEGSRPLWGLIFVHHCRTPRQWTPDEQQLVQAVANQVAIAFEQSLRVQQLQAYTKELEERVKERTRSLERSLQFEQLIRNLTKVLHQVDLDENQMLEVAVEGLVKTLGVAGGYGCLFNRNNGVLEVRYEYLRKAEIYSFTSHTFGEKQEKNQQNSPITSGSLLGVCLSLEDLPESSRNGLLAGKSCFISNQLQKSIARGESETLAIVPIFDALGLIGAICLRAGRSEAAATTERQLEADEIQLVEQVASQCAIAIDRSRTWRCLQAQNQELATLNRVKGELIANTSHELRTPLTAILGFSSVLIQECFGTLNSKQKEYVERINTSGQHLLALINDILDLSRIEAGRLELEPQVVFIAEVVESAIDLIRERAQEQGLTLEVELDPDLEYCVADPRRLKQMLLNLLINAIKFTPAGKVGLKVYRSHLLSESGSTDKINFLVWDNGIGIDLEDQGKLFSPFSQIDSSLSRRYPGTGLGLAIVRKLAELHGGSITLESRKGQGARFTLSLPLLSASE
ncbi:GAF domain-containing protein [Planktothrix sp. FACHB-1355]|uniref:Circadian input-output histidine kinase CikA n=1 Tax=Aerosakkonema funiforme FACHB-1375 TaxID=2949571 RepID=A0A926VA66_9CYAN|nr:MULTISPECIES: ATP-binding protein [Oscillatoriales]MBD2180124.1 GAF domain-containing protein [Aerosakkonema funiforme FACHB-1375]MBD3561301.1 GAF domain-containing protein [Planktothrix sp. FACHB-1355]